MDKADNFRVYQASAGAGKTFTLIKEYLKLCFKAERPEDVFQSILAITFTNAAANEMKAKIVRYLCEIVGLEEMKDEGMQKALVKELDITEEQLKDKAQRLLTGIMHNYSDFCVCTIDAFVQRLSRGFAQELGLPNQYSVSIDDEEMAERIIEGIGMEINGQDDLLTHSLVDFSQDQFENDNFSDIKKQLSDFIKKLLTEKAYQNDAGNQIMDMDHYQKTLAYLKEKEKAFEDEIKAYVDGFRAVEQRYDLHTEDYWQKAKGVASFINKLAEGKYDMPNSYFDQAIDGNKCLGDPSRQDVNEALVGVLKPLRAYFRKNVGAYIFHKTQRKLLYLYALRYFVKKAFEQVAADDEMVHISEFNKRLNEVMGDFSVPFVYERLGEHFQHVFVDEFQDTSILQWQNLLPLIDNGLGSGQMSMVVGDGKQSIYRFRSGEVGQIVNLPDIYAMPQDERKAAFEQYQNALRRNYGFTNLDTNFRSFANVVNFNNAFFEFAYRYLKPESQKVYVDERPDSKDGVKIEQIAHKKEQGLVQVELFDSEKDKDYYFPRIEAIVRDLTERWGYSFGDIAVLTRSKDFGGQVANHLNDVGVPVVSQESILLKSSDKVQLLVSTLRYLIHDDDMVNAANLLYYWKLCQNPDFTGDVSHWFDDLKPVMRGESTMETVMGLKADTLKGALSKATCLYDFCASLLRVYGIDSLRDAFLNYFMEEVFKWQSSTMQGIEEFLAYWDKKKDRSLSVKSVEKNAVQIMTIHKSKGLEYPVVIYPKAITDLNEKLNNRDPEEEWLRPDELGFEAIPNIKKVLFRLDGNAEKMGDIPAQHKEKEDESNRLDNLNLLYVAFTRAKQRLYVIAPQKKEPKSKKVAEKLNALQDFLEQQTDHQVSGELDPDVMLYRFGDPDFTNPKVDETEEKSETEPADSRSAEWFSRVNIEPDPTRLWQSVSDTMQPREWGELVHQIFSKIRCAEEADAVLLPYLNEGTLDLHTAGALKDKFLQMSQHQKVAPAFGPEAKVKTECEVLDPTKHQVLRFDRYAELPDAIYLIDYKTGKHDEENRKQIQNYVAVLSRMTSKEILAYLVYLSEAEIEVMPVSVG